jgi:outer membrane immunogenic protein
MVLGAEADFQLANLKGSLDAPPCPAAACGVALSARFSQKMPWFGTVRGRVGLASDGWMAYVTGGYAYARLETVATATAGPLTDTLTRNDMRSGWAAGAGVEVALISKWSAKLEYLHLDLGTKDGTFALTGLPVIHDSVRLNTNLVRAGVNFRF